MFVSVMLAVSSAAQTSPSGGQRGAALRQQLQRKQRSGAEQQRAQREKAERELEHSHDLADGGAEPALDKSHGKAWSESTSVSTAKPVAVYRCFAAGRVSPRAWARHRQ